MPGKPGELPKQGADGKWYWADGTEVTWAENEALKLSAQGYSQQEIDEALSVAGTFDSSTGAITPGPGQGVRNDAFPNGIPDAGVKGDSNDLLASLGYLPRLVGPGAPGSELDTTMQQESGLELRRLLEDLQQQAATGGGAWEDALAKATQTASASAMALGQSAQNQTGGDYGSALRNIGNAQSAIGQRAVGQGNILRERSKMAAQDQISSLASGMGKTAAEQAAAQAAARRAVRQTNQELINQSEQTTLGTVAGVAQAAMSRGGEVPGEPEVFGDDSRNDTVPAMLSPGEIVIPRSIAEGPDAPARAAAFVEALQRGQAPQMMADGGTAGDDGLNTVPLEELLTPSSKGNIGYQGLRDRYTPAGPPTVEGGGLLDTGAYDYARSAQLQNAGLLAARARGQGPSAVGQMLQNTSDSNLAAAMQAQQAGKLGGADALMGAATDQSRSAGQAGGLAAEEQLAGQQGASQAFLDQQARDNAFAIAQQQAAWGNTLMNVGLGLDQQARLQDLFSAAGQGLMAASSLDFGDLSADDSGDDSGENEYGYTEEDYDSNEMENEYAHGGVVHAAAMACGGKAKGYAEGGMLPPRKGALVGQVVTPYGVAIDPGFMFPDSGVQMQDPTTGEWVRLKKGVPTGGVTASGDAPEPEPPPAAQPGLLQRAFAAMKPGPGEPSARQVESNLVNAPTDAAMAAQKTRAQLGITPKGAEPPPQAPQQPTAPMVAAGRPRAPGVGQPGTSDIRAGLDAQAAGVETEAAAKEAQAVATVKALDAAQQVAQKNALEMKQRSELAKQRTDAMQSQYLEAVEAMKNVATTVDPGRYWASRTTGQKVLGIIGLALGAIGAGKDGINRAAQQLHRAIEMDVDAQKAQAGAALQKGRAAVDAAGGAFAQARQIFQDDMAAAHATKAFEYDLAELELKKVMASTSSPMAKAQAEQLLGQIQASKGKEINAAYNVAFDNQTARMLAEGQTARAGGAAVTPEQRNMVATSRDKAMQLTQQADRLISLIKKHGTDESGAPLIGTPGVAREMDLLSHGMAKDMASMTDPKTGVRDAEMEAMSKTIFKRGYGQFDADAIAGLEALKSYAAKRYLTDLQATAP